MARFAVIGLGKFGSHVARNLFENGHEVVGLDADAGRVQDLRDHCSQAVQAESTDREVLKALEIGACDAVVMSLGERVDASVLTMLYLRELGVKRVVAKAVSPDHGRVLSLLGATEIVQPEINLALRVAAALGAHSVLEYLPLGVGFSLLELAAPARFRGQTLAQLQMRGRFGVLVVAVKNGGRLELAPGGDYALAEGDILVMIGRDEDLSNVARSARA